MTMYRQRCSEFVIIPGRRPDSSDGLSKLVAGIMIKNAFRHREIAIVGLKIQAKSCGSRAPRENVDLREPDWDSGSREEATHPEGTAGVPYGDRPNSRTMRCA